MTAFQDSSKRRAGLMRRRVLPMLLALALGAGTAGAEEDLVERYEVARAAYERNHWQQAFDAFAALAEQGHPEAARLALQMWRHGPRLYRIDFAATPVQLKRWSLTCDCDGMRPQQEAAAPAA